MDKNNIEIPEKKVDKKRIAIIAPILASVILFTVDLYLMINKPGSYTILAIVTLLMLAGIYVFINTILQEINAEKKAASEQYENIFKSGKASYLLLKKVQEQIEAMDERNKADSAQNIITAQKAIAKVTISRNKENADALMNSNDKVLEKMFDFQEKFETNSEAILEEQKNIMDGPVKELMDKQQELALHVKELESDLKKEFMQMQDLINALPDKLPTVAAKPLSEEEPLLEEEPLFDSMDLGESGNLPEEEPFFDDMDLGESENLLEEEPPFDGLDGLDFVDDSISLLDEESVIEEPVTEEPIQEKVPEPMEKPEEEPAEEKPSMPDLSDPHKLMTPDEIAALIANM